MTDPLAEAKKVAEAEGDEVKVALLDAVEALDRYRMNINSSKTAMLGRIADAAIERVEALLSAKGGRG